MKKLSTENYILEVWGDTQACIRIRRKRKYDAQAFSLKHAKEYAEALLKAVEFLENRGKK